MLLTSSPAPHGNTSDKKQDMDAGAQQCTLALASAADPKSLLMALGMVGDTEQGQSCSHLLHQGRMRELEKIWVCWEGRIPAQGLRQCWAESPPSSV